MSLMFIGYPSPAPETKNMTEEEWLTSESPYDMMGWLTNDHRFHPTRGGVTKHSDRKFLLYCLACCREAEDQYPSVGEDAEWCIKHHATPASHPRNWAMAWSGDQRDPPESRRADIIRDVFGNPHRPHPPLWREEVVSVDPKEMARKYPKMRRAIESYSDRELVQKVRRSAHWITPQVTDLAKVAYQERRGDMCDQCEGVGSWYAGYVKDLFGPTVKCEKCEGRGHMRGSRIDSLTLMAMCDAAEEAGCQDDVILRHLRCDKIHYYGCWAVDMILGET